MPTTGPVSRGTISPLLTPGLRKVYYEIGKERPLEYPLVFNVDTMDWNPQTDQQVIGIGQMPAKPEGDTFTLDAHDIGGTKQYFATPLGLALELTWAAWRDELYGVLQEMVADGGRAT